MVIDYKKFTPCRKCMGKGPQKGFYYAERNGKTVAVECDCHKEWERTNELLRLLGNSGISEDVSFDNYRGTESINELNALRTFARSPEKYKNILVYIYGNDGCQKTYMAKALGKELLLKGYTVKFVQFENFLSNIQTDFKATNVEERENFVRECKEVDFLFLDDAFCVEHSTMYASGWQLPFLNSFFRERIENLGKSIILVSKVKPTDLSSVGYGTSFQDFIVYKMNKGAYLHFKDIWNKNSIDTNGLFHSED